MKTSFKSFFKNRETNPESFRKKHWETAMVTGMAVNTVLFVVKLSIGMFIGSIAVIADSVNNLTDSLTNLLIILGLKMATKPPDREHPFGHGRVEYLTSLVIASLILVVSFEFLRSSISVILNPTEIIFTTTTVAVLVATALAKLWQSVYYSRTAEKISSDPLRALAVDSRNDVAVTSVTIVGILVSYFSDFIVDGYLGVFISFLILYSGYTLAKETISKLLGESVDENFADQIQNLAESYDNVLSSHDLIVHSYGPDRTMATLHVDMPDSLSLSYAHSIVDEIERRSKKELGITLLLHVDPVAVEDIRLKAVKEKVKTYTALIDPKIDSHDFKITEKEGRDDIVFELVFPHNFDKKKEGVVVLSLETILKTMDKNYNPIIETEHRFIK